MQEVYTQVIRAIHQNSVKELYLFWKVSLTCKDGEIIRKFITDGLEELAEALALKETIVSFQDLYRCFKTKRVEIRCQRPGHALIHYTRKLNVEGISCALEQCKLLGRTHFVNRSCKLLGKYASVEFIKQILDRYTAVHDEDKFFNYILKGAVQNENLPVIDFILATTRNPYQLSGGFEGALKIQNFGWIYYFISLGIRVDCYGLYYGAKFNNRKMMTFFHTEGMPWAVEGAVSAGNVDLVKELLDKLHGNNKDYALIGGFEKAACKNNKELVDLFLDLDAIGIKNAQQAAIMNGHLDMVRYLAKKGCLYTKEDLILADECEQSHIIDYLNGKELI